jgi:beta-galactosidase
MRHKTLGVEQTESGLVVRERVAAAGVDHGMEVVYRWSADAAEGGTLWLTVELEPYGTWPCTLPRRGVALTLPGSLDHVEWFGSGPGEAYRDTGNDARVGRHKASVADMQTPYVRPQENGNRRDVRWARFTDESGVTGVQILPAPRTNLTARPWSTQALEAAQHRNELRPDGLIHLHLDDEQTGIGSSSCGAPLPKHAEVRPVRAMFSLGFRKIGG